MMKVRKNRKLKNLGITIAILLSSTFCFSQYEVNQDFNELDNSIKIDSLIKLSKAQLGVSLHEALKYAERANATASKLRNDTLKIKTLQMLAKVFADSGEYNQAIVNYDKAVKTANAIHDYHTSLSLYKKISKLYSKTQNNNKAIANYKQAIEFFNNIEDKYYLASTYNSLGLQYNKMNINDSAITELFHSLKLAEKNNYTLISAYANNNIGLVCLNQEDNSKAIEYFIKASEDFIKIDKHYITGKTYNNIALIYLNQKKYDSALVYLQKSFFIKEELGDSTSIISTINNFGLLFEKQEKYSLALEKYLIVYHYSLKQGNTYNKALAANNVGFAYFKLGSFALAEKYLNEALGYAVDIESDKLYKIVYESFYKLYNKQQDYKNAFKYYNLFSQAKDSLFTIEKEKLIADIETKYESEKQQREILLLKKDNILIKERNFRQRIIVYAIVAFLFISVLFSISFFRSKKKIKSKNQSLREKNKKINKQKEELQISNATKDKFFSIIAHDLRSPFNSMLGFAGLLKNEFDDYNTEEKKKFIGLIYNGLENTLKLLDDLLSWARSQKGTIAYNPEKINLLVLTNEISELLNQSIENKSIKLINELELNTYVEADRDMLATIIRNLLSNAIKFTNKHGEITINAELIKDENNNQFAEICVSDTGMGIPKKIQSKIFDIGENTSMQGTENETGTGLGLILCKEFVEKHGGKIWFKSEVGKGSSFFFTIPY